ncbi:hypothetical protein GCM10009117_00140 [Gangjinia marincola]|uniref:Lipoprotein n=1 Tax=Gangjinia marincola TaxID=578463 RepID=A0ABP3XRJ0_9FLAO
MKLKLTLILIVTLFLYSCGKKFSGKSEQEFTSSRLKVEEDLTTVEKEKLEKAFRIVALHAMSEKWNNPEDYSDSSINEITLDVVNNKTYGDLINFAENFLEEENDKKVLALEEEISQLKNDRKSTDSIITILNDFQVSEIDIREGSWDSPQITTKIINTGSLKGITEYLFDLEIYSIAKQKKIDGVGSGGSFKEGWNNDKDKFFTYVSRSLSPLMDRSKRLKEQLQNPKYPIKDLAKYDLEVNVKVRKIILSDGTSYIRPKKELFTYDDEIQQLQEKLNQLKGLKVTLDELEIKELGSKEEVAYNEEYLTVLSNIRQERNKVPERSQQISESLILSFPSNYQIRKEKHPGTYILSLNDNLVFDNTDKNLVQYQIKDTAYVEYEKLYDKPSGILNILKKENVSYDIKETIAYLKETGYYTLIDADETGYIYLLSDTYRLTRYFNTNGTHYVYTMDFKNITEAIREFDRSKELIVSKSF